MELYKEVLVNAFERNKINVSFNNPQIDLTEIVESQCYAALRKIKAVIEDDSLSDSECFMKIEEIVRIFEEIGSGGGSRHDFR